MKYLFHNELIFAIILLAPTTQPPEITTSTTETIGKDIHVLNQVAVTVKMNDPF